MTDTATPDGQRLIEAWLKAKERVASAKRETEQPPSAMRATPKAH
jgi:hypothetical protein